MGFVESNIYGKSILKNVYTIWHLRKKLENLEDIGKRKIDQECTCDSGQTERCPVHIVRECE